MGWMWEHRVKQDGTRWTEDSGLQVDIYGHRSYERLVIREELSQEEFGPR